MSDTIFALASAKGRSGVAVVRVSGPDAFKSCKMLCGDQSPELRTALLRHIKDPVSRETIDQGVVILFQGPASYTGEDVVEYHLHGSVAILQHFTDVLSKQPNHRLAEPGEFTRRAFENEKMDLTEAEAVADLINAETQMQKAQALMQMEGALSRLYDGWRESLSRILAHVEADLEFPDEDMPEGILPQVMPQIKALAEDIDRHLNDKRRGERLRDGVSVVVIGAPNAGKSSLVNALAQRDVAIVSDMAGTTRDVIDVHLDLGGYPVILSDTAGLRPDQLSDKAGGHDAVEGEGIRRAMKKAQEADIRLLLFDGSQNVPDKHTFGMIDSDSVVALNKIDQGIPDFADDFTDYVGISAASGEGIEQLLAKLGQKIEGLIGLNEAPALTRQRHRDALTDCIESLRRSEVSALPELAAEDLRLAIRALGKITGRVDVEDLLDIVFRDFCIGK